jgi:hypothetical protein
MGEVRQQTILSADIAPSGKRCSLEAAGDASEPCGLARSLHWLDEPAISRSNRRIGQRVGRKALGAFSNEQV